MKTSRLETKVWRRGSQSRILILSLALLALLFGIPGLATKAEAVTDSYTTAGSGTWTAPGGVTSVTVECWAGGGAGGGSSANPGAGGGGAGGQYSRKVVAVTPGNNYAYTVGAGGVGVSGANGGAGGDSTFATTVAVAKGGAGGIFDGAGAAGSATGGVGDTVYAGGNGAAGVLAGSSGGGGGGAGSTGGGGNASGGTAGTGTTIGGGTGGAGISTALAGNPGSAAGGGGSGGKSTANPNFAGGAGGAGRVDITYTLCVDTDLATLTIAAPTESATVSGTTRINLSVGTETLPAGMINVQFSINGGAYVNATGWDGTYWYYDWDTTAVTDGAATINARGTDPDCSTEVNAPVRNVTASNVCSDPDPATLTMAAPAESATVSGTTRINLSVGTETLPAGLINVQFSINGGAYVNADSWDGTYWYYDWDTTAVANGAATINARGTDPDCGDLKTAPVRNVTVNNSVIANQLTSCAGCHAFPPLDGPRSKDTGAVVGDHEKHNTTPSCGVCHIAPPDETSAYFGHRNGTIRLNDNGNIRGGSYSRGPSFSQSKNPTTGTCSAVSCHGGAATPQWGVGTTTCTTCHALLPPASGAHAIHYSAKGWTTGNADNCDECHPDNTTGHSDVSNAPSVVINAGLSAGGISPAITCGATTTGCHNGKTTPAWNASGIACTACHSSSGAAAGDPTTGLHRVSTALKHDNSLQSGNCVNCHSRTSPSSLHWNGTVNNPATATFTYNSVTVSAYTTANGCQATCHSDGADWRRRWVGVTDAKPLATDNPGAAVCNNCHGDFTSGWRWNEANATTVDHTDPYAGNNPGSAANNFGNYLGWASGSHANCQACHGWGDAGYNKAWRGASDIAYIGHGDGHITMNGPDSPLTGSGYDNDTGGCAAACHSIAFVLKFNSGWTANYANFGAGACNQCHGYPPVPSGYVTGVGNFQDGSTENYGGGGGSHVKAKHLILSVRATDGWGPCTSCHTESDHSTSAASTALQWQNNRTAQLYPKVRPDVTSKPWLNWGGTAHYTQGAADNSDNKGLGQCFNLSCHFAESPKWDCSP